jgi:SAM-dependent methyltransferase
MGPAHSGAALLDLQLAIGYVPTPQPVVTAMLSAARLKPGELLYDLGCGDGRIVLTAARDFGARGVGFDLNVTLIHAARALAEAGNARHTATYRLADLFSVDLSEADVVALFLRPEANRRLRPQLQRLRPGARVVSYEFRLGDLEPARSELVEYAPGRSGRVLVWEAPLEPSHEAQQQQQEDRADDGRHDVVDQAGADVKMEGLE